MTSNEPPRQFDGRVDVDHNQVITDAVTNILKTRGPLEQTKGMLMVVYGINEDEAFELLRAHARKTRSKINAFARQFRDDVARLNHQGSIPTQAVFDQILTTTHQRITPTVDAPEADLTSP